MPDPITPRPSVQAFAEAMEMRLREADGKGRFTESEIDMMQERLGERAIDLSLATFEAPFDRVEILYAAADVANFALMIADVTGALETEGGDGE